MKVLVQGVSVFSGVAALLLCFLFVAVVAAQVPDTSRTRVVQILGADQMTMDEVNGEPIRRLLGDVSFLHEDTRLWADNVIQYLERDEILFQGHVRIIERGDTLTADQVLYDTRRKVGNAQGKVLLSDGEVQVEAPSGRYFTEEKRATFTEGVTLVDSSTVLTSRSGDYWSDEKRAEFYEEVQLESDRTYLEADSITYFRETEVSIARGEVFIFRSGGEEDAAEADTTAHTFLFGAWAYNENQTGLSRVRGNPLLIQVRTDSTGTPTDTLIIHSKRLETTRKDSLQRLVAIDSVEIWQRDFAAVADSVVYERIRPVGATSREESRLFGDPMAWFQESQVSGDTLRVSGRNNKADSLLVQERTFVAQMDTLLGRIQQLRGRTLLGLFEDDTLRTLRVAPNAEAIYYLRNDEEQPDGAVKATADRIIFHLQDNALKNIRVYEGIEGTYYPEDLLPGSFNLDGYQWVPERRPTKTALLQEERVQRRLAAYALPTLPPEIPVPAETGPLEQQP